MVNEVIFDFNETHMMTDGMPRCHKINNSRDFILSTAIPFCTISSFFVTTRSDLEFDLLGKIGQGIKYTVLYNSRKSADIHRHTMNDSTWLFFEAKSRMTSSNGFPCLSTATKESSPSKVQGTPPGVGSRTDSGSSF